jgi:hypothetical protein
MIGRNRDLEREGVSTNRQDGKYSTTHSRHYSQRRTRRLVVVGLLVDTGALVSVTGLGSGRSTGAGAEGNPLLPVTQKVAWTLYLARVSRMLCV